MCLLICDRADGGDGLIHLDHTFELCESVAELTGNLLRGAPWASPKFGVELDPEAAQSYDGQGAYNIVEGSTPKFDEAMTELVNAKWCVLFTARHHIGCVLRHDPILIGEDRMSLARSCLRR